MRRTVSRNKGVTLVEVMIALVILLIVFLGLIQASIVSINSNMRNLLRDEAVRLTSDLMTRLRAVDFDTLNDTTYDAAQTRRIRNTSVIYNIDVTVTDIDTPTNNRLIRIATSWTWQSEGFTHAVESYRRR